MRPWTAPQVTRVGEPFVGDERAMLEGYLDWYRATLLSKCAGLGGAELIRAACPPSDLTLLGLVRHLTNVERSWFRHRFGGQPAMAVYERDGRRDAAFEDLDPERAEEVLSRFVEECEQARIAVVGLPLDTVYLSDRWGEMSLRWLYLHMLEEYARHCGHADLLRQAIDGAVE